MAKKADIGLFGLGVMGSNLALNIAENGFSIAVYNRELGRIDDFLRDSGPLAGRILPARSLEELVAAIEPPRAIILMIPAGKPVDMQIAALTPLLAQGDVIVDGGNSDFRDTVRRVESLKGTGVTLIGMGVSGGEEGARRGPSMMAGGDLQAFARIEPVVMKIAAKARDGEPCAAWLGPDGAGHFVKTIHNGIEYADMQMIAEIYGVLRDGAGLEPAQIAGHFARWNEGPLESYLVEITAKVLKAVDADTGKPMVDIIQDRAGQKGTGVWSAIEAQRLGRPASGIEAAVGARVLSSLKAERIEAAKLFGEPRGAGLAPEILDDLERALFAGKVVAYAQGFSVMQAASDAFGWNLPLPTIAKIWRAGCIIRSRFLGDIADAFAGDPVPNLLVAPAFATLMREAHPALRRVVAAASLAELPVPALSAALGYFDTYRQSRGTADLIQGQRDFFGAHGFERIDREGPHHGKWGIDEQPVTPGSTTY
ncbi:MAG TPA: NADP-dependent phosphogluconate dehydrogenase [Mesorhizobium sp.]|nr:NADP-dependent phosphogluconate dehydrogenase [Mesorhizobium sp.]